MSMNEKHKHSNQFFSRKNNLARKSTQLCFVVKFRRESRLLWWQSCRWENFATLSAILSSRNKFQLLIRNSSAWLRTTGTAFWKQIKTWSGRSDLRRIRNLKEFAPTRLSSRATSGPAKRRSSSRLQRITETRYQHEMKLTIRKQNQNSNVFI